MDDIDDLIKEIILTLNSELPLEYESTIKNFKKLVGNDLMRASYDELDAVCRKSNWRPSVKLLGLIDRYKMIF